MRFVPPLVSLCMGHKGFLSSRCKAIKRVFYLQLCTLCRDFSSLRSLIFACSACIASWLLQDHLMSTRNFSTLFTSSAWKFLVLFACFVNPPTLTRYSKDARIKLPTNLEEFPDYPLLVNWLLWGFYLQKDIMHPLASNSFLFLFDALARPVAGLEVLKWRWNWVA